ncbi:hypothetical protein NDU88_006216 [Pleurodeles waltl]|uniref:Uncharacterized protein n=1 Tax=Pleurodeles waltl TaxID=8319 RepID=A0AAV7MDG2_PLEWA|nr:hypothetical protein NDU88_006216 [Pleurodeles waltl]
MDILNGGNILKLLGQTPGLTYITSDTIKSVEFIERGPGEANKSTKVIWQSYTLARAVLKENKHFRKWGIILEGAEDPGYPHPLRPRKSAICTTPHCPSGSKRHAPGTIPHRVCPAYTPSTESEG